MSDIASESFKSARQRAEQAFDEATKQVKADLEKAKKDALTKLKS
jgi:hypothetical protein